MVSLSQASPDSSLPDFHQVRWDWPRGTDKLWSRLRQVGRRRQRPEREPRARGGPHHRRQTPAGPRQENHPDALQRAPRPGRPQQMWSSKERKSRSNCGRKALVASKAVEEFKKTGPGKKQEQKIRRAGLTDFERFKAMVLRKRVKREREFFWWF